MTRARVFRSMTPRRLVALSGLGLLVLSSVAGCSMFHSNIKGGFACTAPDGSCAPTTIIDDGALRTIRQAEEPDGRKNLSGDGGDLIVPSGSGTGPPTQAASVILAADRLGKDARAAGAIKGHALRVVYPAHLDASGRLVPKTIAYALVDLPEWAERQTGPIMTVDGKVTTGISRGLLGAAEHAPEALAMLPASARVSVADQQPGTASPSAHAASPSPPTPPSAAPDAGSTSPIDRIKAEAAQILGSSKVKTAGTFSPIGNNP